MTEGVTSTGFANQADYRKRFFHLSMNERQSLKFVKFRQAPQPYHSRVGGMMWHMPCSLLVQIHIFLRPDAPDD